MVPPGLADNESGRATLSSVSVLNYGHISASMVLRPFQLGLPFPLSFFSRSKRAKSYRVDESGSFHEAVSVQIADETYQGGFETSQASAATLGYVPSRMKRSIAAFEHAKRDWKNPLNLLNLLPAPLYDHCMSLFLSIFLSLVTDSFTRNVVVPAAYLADLDLMQSTATLHQQQAALNSSASSETLA